MKSMMKRVSTFSGNVDMSQFQQKTSARRGSVIANIEKADTADPLSPALKPGASPSLLAMGSPARALPVLPTQMTAGASADAVVLQRQFDALVISLAQEFSPDRISSITSLEKEIASLRSEVDAMEASMSESDKFITDTKARVARLETIISNISLAKLIERIMQVPLHGNGACGAGSSGDAIAAHAVQQPLCISAPEQRAYFRRNARLGWGSLMVTYAMSPQSALVRTWLRLLRSIIDAETSLVHDLRVLSLAFYRPFIYEVVRQKRLASNPGRSASSSSSTTGEWLSNEDVSFLFGNLETVYSIHASFLTSLERQFSLWPNPGWGGFAGAFRMFFNALRTVLSSLGTSPQRLARIAFERLSALPEFQTLLKQCEALPVCRGHTFVSLLSVQYTKLEQLMKNCSEWVCACDAEYFEKQELDSIIKDFSTFYNKATTSKRVSNMTVDSLQFHRQSVIKLAKRFPVFQTWLFKSDLNIKLELTCHAMLPATPGSAQQLVQVVVSSKHLVIASHGTVVDAAATETRDQTRFLQNIAAAALAAAPRASEEAPLTMMERWQGISRVRLLELKGQLAIAVSRSHPPLFKKLIPYEPSPQSAATILRHKSLQALVHAFASSVLRNDSPRFMLSALIEWLLVSCGDLQSLFGEDADDIDPQVAQHAMDSLITGEMTVAKAMALAHEAALLCMIFPMQPVVGDTSFSFPDTSVIFSRSLATMRRGDDDIPTSFFVKRKCYCRYSSRVHETAMAFPVWCGEFHTLALDESSGQVAAKVQLAVLHRKLVSDESSAVEVADKLCIFESKWHNSPCKRIDISSKTSCHRVMFAPDGQRLPLSDCVMKLDNGDENVVFRLNADLLVQLQHTNADIQLDDSAFVDQRGFRTSVMSFADESDVDFSDFGGGWHMILPMSTEDHFRLFEALLPLVSPTQADAANLHFIKEQAIRRTNSAKFGYRRTTVSSTLEANFVHVGETAARSDEDVAQPGKQRSVRSTAKF